MPLQNLFYCFLSTVLRVFYLRSDNLGTTVFNDDTALRIDRQMLRTPKVNKATFKPSFSYSYDGPIIFIRLPFSRKYSYICKHKNFPQ